MHNSKITLKIYFFLLKIQNVMHISKIVLKIYFKFSHRLVFAKFGLVESQYRAVQSVESVVVYRVTSGNQEQTGMSQR